MDGGNECAQDTMHWCTIGPLHYRAYRVRYRYLYLTTRTPIMLVHSLGIFMAFNRTVKWG